MPHYNRHFSGDPFAATGFWGPPSSRVNFCEEDYAITRYIAEFINSLTNLAYVYYALRSPKAPGARGRYFGLDSMAASLFLVGVASFTFHASLRQLPQFSDDMSMFLLGSALLHALYTSGHRPAAAGAIGMAIVSTVAAVSAVYYRSGDVQIHFFSFLTMEMLIGLRTLYLIHRRDRPAAEVSRLDWRFAGAAGLLVVAFVLWNIDLEKCFELRAIRESVGLPWALLFELHGWWHVLTAVASAKYIELVRDIC